MSLIDEQIQEKDINKKLKTEKEVRDSQEYQILIRNFSFEPKMIVINRNSTVKWIVGDNRSNYKSLYSNEERQFVIAIDDLQVESLPLCKGQSFSHKFKTKGKFEITCPNYIYIKGYIEVIDSFENTLNYRLKREDDIMRYIDDFKYCDNLKKINNEQIDNATPTPEQKQDIQISVNPEDLQNFSYQTIQEQKTQFFFSQLESSEESNDDIQIKRQNLKLEQILQLEKNIDLDIKDKNFKKEIIKINQNFLEQKNNSNYNLQSNNYLSQQQIQQENQQDDYLINNKEKMNVRTTQSPKIQNNTQIKVFRKNKQNNINQQIQQNNGEEKKRNRQKKHRKNKDYSYTSHSEESDFSNSDINYEKLQYYKKNNPVYQSHNQQKYIIWEKKSPVQQLSENNLHEDVNHKKKRKKKNKKKILNNSNTSSQLQQSVEFPTRRSEQSSSDQEYLTIKNINFQIKQNEKKEKQFIQNQKQLQEEQLEQKYSSTSQQDLMATELIQKYCQTEKIKFIYIQLQESQNEINAKLDFLIQRFELAQLLQNYL